MDVSRKSDNFSRQPTNNIGNPTTIAPFFVTIRQHGEWCFATTRLHFSRQHVNKRTLVSGDNLKHSIWMPRIKTTINTLSLSLSLSPRTLCWPNLYWIAGAYIHGQCSASCFLHTKTSIFEKKSSFSTFWVHFLKVQLPYDPVYSLVGLTVFHNFLIGEKFQFNAHIFILYCQQMRNFIEADVRLYFSLFYFFFSILLSSFLYRIIRFCLTIHLLHILFPITSCPF